MNKLIQLHDLYFTPYLDAATIQNRVEEMGLKLTEEYKGKKPIFLAILNGSFLFAADLVRHCAMDIELSFIKLTSYEGLASSGKVVTHIGLEENLADRHVVVIEDIIDTGTTLHHFLPTLQQANPASIAIVSLLTKPTALKYPLQINQVGFTIPNKFVVGYGLDYNGLGRNLPSIYQLKE